MTTPADYTQQLLAYLQAWRRYLEQTMGTTATAPPVPAASWAMPATPAAPLAPPMPPPAAGLPMTMPPTDYTQQLLSYLQAWRQYLEQAMGSAAPGQPYPTTPSPAATTPTAPPSATPATSPPPAATTTPAGPPQPRSTTSVTPTPVQQIVPPYDPNRSMISFKHTEGEPFSQGESLYPSHSILPSEPAGEHQFGSAFPGAQHPVASGAPEAPARSLYPLFRTSATQPEPHRGQEGEAVSRDRPDHLEFVRPLKDSSR
jgi:hypothetical protein